MGAKLIEIYNVNSTSCVLNTRMNAHKYSQTFVLGSLPGTTFSLTIHNFLLTLPCLSKNERALKTVAVLIARCSRLDLTAHITHIWHSTGWFFSCGFSETVASVVVNSKETLAAWYGCPDDFEGIYNSSFHHLDVFTFSSIVTQVIIILLQQFAKNHSRIKSSV